MVPKSILCMIIGFTFISFVSCGGSSEEDVIAGSGSNEEDSDINLHELKKRTIAFFKTLHELNSNYEFPEDYNKLNHLDTRTGFLNLNGDITYQTQPKNFLKIFPTYSEYSKKTIDNCYHQIDEKNIYLKDETEEDKLEAHYKDLQRMLSKLSNIENHTEIGRVLRRDLKKVFRKLTSQVDISLDKLRDRTIALLKSIRKLVPGYEFPESYHQLGDITAFSGFLKTHEVTYHKDEQKFKDGYEKYEAYTKKAFDDSIKEIQHEHLNLSEEKHKKEFKKKYRDLRETLQRFSNKTEYYVETSMNLRVQLGILFKELMGYEIAGSSEEYRKIHPTYGYLYDKGDHHYERDSSSDEEPHPHISTHRNKSHSGSSSSDDEEKLYSRRNSEEDHYIEEDELVHSRHNSGPVEPRSRHSGQSYMEEEHRDHGSNGSGSYGE